MKQRTVCLFLLGILYNPLMSFSQDSIPVSPDLEEVNFLKFQDHFFKALAEKSIYNYKVAIQNLEKCNELLPKDVSVLFELSKNYLMLKQFLEAEVYAKQALSIEPRNYWVLEHLLKIYIVSNNVKSAIPIQEQLDVQNPKEKGKLVQLYFQNNQIGKARSVILQLKNENALTPELKDFEERFLKETVKKKISAPTNLEGLVKGFEKNKNFDALRKILILSAEMDNKTLLSYSTIGVELFPAQAFVYLMNARALNKNKNYSSAIEQLTNGIDFVIDDNSLEADFYDELAISYHGLGNQKEAIKNKNKALALRK